MDSLILLTSVLLGVGVCVAAVSVWVLLKRQPARAALAGGATLILTAALLALLGAPELALAQLVFGALGGLLLSGSRFRALLAPEAVPEQAPEPSSRKRSASTSRAASQPKRPVSRSGA